jgi:hypothetical protein
MSYGTSLADILPAARRLFRPRPYPQGAKLAELPVLQSIDQVRVISFYSGFIRK